MAEIVQITSSSVEPPAGTPPPAAADPSRPAWLPENFTKPEDLATSYKTLQAELTALKQGKAPPTPPVTPPVVDPTKPAQTPEEAAAKATASAGLNMSELEAEVTQTGKLSEARYAALAKAGIPKEMVDEFITHRTNANLQVVNQTLELAGGQQQFQSMAAWAKSAYTPVQLDAYNKAINSGNAGQMQMAVKGLRADYERVKGVQPTLLQPNTAAPGGGDVYHNMNQLLADQSDPRYKGPKSDPAFRAQVAAKLARSGSI